jgi:hypothetical protein
MTNDKLQNGRYEFLVSRRKKERRVAPGSIFGAPAFRPDTSALPARVHFVICYLSFVMRLGRMPRPGA